MDQLGEDETIIRAHTCFGNKCATIARLLNGCIDNAIKSHWNSTLKLKSSSISEDLINNNAHPQQPLRRFASLDAGTNFLGLHLNQPNSPLGSDLSDSSLPDVASSPVYRPLARIVSLLSLSLSSIDALSSTTYSPTLLSLSLLESNSCEASNETLASVFGSNHTINLNPISNHIVETPEAPAQVPVSAPTTTAPLQQAPLTQENGGGFRGEIDKQSFSTEFLAMMQEMIRKEVRNYMSGIQHDGLCFQTEAIKKQVLLFEFRFRFSILGLLFASG